jgi:hypothetical protein
LGEAFSSKKLDLEVWEICGGSQPPETRRFAQIILVAHYLLSVQAVIWVVDASGGREVLERSVEALQTVLKEDDRRKAQGEPGLPILMWVIFYSELSPFSRSRVTETGFIA